jgi:hypothetical protein
MVKNVDLDDFRAIRRVLELDDFAVTDGKPTPPPTDLIDQEAWDHVMTLPGHVAITTTSYQGSKIALLHELSSEWIFSKPMKGITGYAMSSIWDGFESSIFNTIHGYYKTALTILRVALETSVVAARCALAGDQARWDRWNAGAEFKFGNVCDEILRLPDVKAREDEVVARVGVGMFEGCAPRNSDAWVRSLYGRLCRYSHARGDTTDASIWRSNGPVYSADGLKLCYETFLEIYALVLILAKWSQGRMGLKRNGKLILKQQSLPVYMDEPFQAVAACYRDWLWKPSTGRPRRAGTRK